MSTLDSKFYKKKKSSTFYFSLVFFAIILILTGVLYVFTSSVQAEGDSLSGKIKELDASIEKLESDENVQVYRTYSRHKDLLELLGRQSEIPLFVSHLKKNFQKFGLEGSGFEYRNGVVTIAMESKTWQTRYAYQRIVEMLREYKKDEKALFDLGEIQDFSGHDQIDFSAEFYLK